jgi:hypothetical protein
MAARVLFLPKNQIKQPVQHWVIDRDWYNGERMKNIRRIV